MLNKKIENAFNNQINKEVYSSYLYQALSAHSSYLGLDGIANWFQIQVQEEISHAQKIYNFINERGGKVKLKTIEEPPSEFESVIVMFEETLKHEEFITKSINELMDLAISEKDHASQIFLQWFVTEQVEEEDNVNTILNDLKLISDSGNGLRMLDKELATRVFTQPTE
ncbi:MAG: ferritin [Candidatus Marinimicrobia bacterium]|nr:ferritin [Candidatus Neomarinimicrobiota bacterium]